MLMRLDLYLYEKSLAFSRTNAKALITEGKVFIDGKAVTKPSFDVLDTQSVSVSEEDYYVSRGAYKLKGALDAFGISPKDKHCLDVGASTGGFTDLLLRDGAAHVIALDSGSGQLAQSLRQDVRVTSIEGYNARYMRAEELPYAPDFAVMDVSFISATHIIPALYSVLQSPSDFICLIKPQFEVGRACVGKGGIVRNEKAAMAAVDGVIEFAKNVGFKFKGKIKSSILGGDGNVEYLAYFAKE